jgi:hypothetical protein
LEFRAEAGRPYYIFVDGFLGGGDYRLNIGEGLCNL